MGLSSRREFLKSAGVAAGALAAGQAASERQPNLLFVLAGGFRAQALEQARAPNIGALAKQGTQFDRLYTCNPSEGPSRAALITGRFPSACGVPRDGLPLALDQPSIAELLRLAGYRTGYIGEWRLDGDSEPGFVPPGPRRHGFDYWAAFNRGHRYFDSVYFGDTAEPIHAAGFEPDYQTDLAVTFLKQDWSKPFYLFLAWGPPHPAPTPAPGAANLYEPREIQARANVPQDQEKSARDDCARYDALCSGVDRNLGRLMNALADQNLDQRTIVVFTSDTGTMLGSQGLEGDDEPFEEAVRVPFIMRYPGVLNTARKQDALLSNVDLMPSLLGFCGIDVPEAVQGQDLSTWMARGEGSARESIYASGMLGSPGEWRMVVRGLDKLVVDRDLNATHLYNLGQDPFEMENLSRDFSQELKRDELKALLRDWMRRTGDGMDPSGLKKR